MPEFFDYDHFIENYPEELEKKGIRRIATATGIALLGLFGIMFFWPIFYFRIAAILGFTPHQAENISREPVINQLLQIVISMLMIFLPFFIATKVQYLKIKKLVPFSLPKTKNLLPIIVLGLGFCLFASYATNLGSIIFDSFNIYFPNPKSELPKGVLGGIIMVLSTAFFPAFLEELVMRGMVLGYLKKFGSGFASICSALVFGFMHANAQQIVFAFFVGIILGFITIKTDSIWPAIAVHFLNNLISVVFSYLNSFVSDSNMVSVAYIFIFSIIILFSFLSFIKISREDSEFLTIKSESQNNISETKKIKWFVSSPLIIISFAVSLFIAFFLR